EELKAQTVKERVDGVVIEDLFHGVGLIVVAASPEILLLRLQPLALGSLALSDVDDANRFSHLLLLFCAPARWQVSSSVCSFVAGGRLAVPGRRSVHLLVEQ